MKGADLSNMDVSGDFFAKAEVMANLQDQLLAAGIRSGVDSAITGADFSDSLKTNLRFAAAAVIGAQLSQEIGIEFAKNQIDPEQGIGRGAQLIAHAVTGCAAGAVGTGNCGAGAAGQLAGEIAGLLYKGDLSPAEIDAQTQEWKNRGVDMARLSGALAAAVAGGDAADINLGSDAGGTAAANNALLGLAVVLAGLAGVGTTYATIQGEGDTIEGLKLIARSEDDVGRLYAQLSEMSDTAIGTVLAENFPEFTEDSARFVIIAGEALGNGADMAVTFIDKQSNGFVTTTWSSIPDSYKETMFGTAKLGIYLAGNASLAKHLKTGGVATSAGLASNAVNAKRLAEQLRLESALSPFKKDGFLTDEAIKNSTRIFPANEIKNPRIPEGFGKYTTDNFQSPSGNFQVHFYKNDVTGEVFYDYDYKAIFGSKKK